MASTAFLDFFKNAAEGTKIDLGQKSGASLFGTNESISSGKSSSIIESISSKLSKENSILKSNLFNQQEINSSNLINLGKASIDISTALNNNIQIREDQRAETFGAINGLADIVGSINERLSKQVTELGQSVTDVSKAQDGDNPLSFLTKNPLLFGLGTGGLIAAGVAAFILLKR